MNPATTDIDVALAAAGAGAAVVRAAYGTRSTRHAKSDRDFATAADLDAEHAILDVLTKKRPRDRILSEESGESASRSRIGATQPTSVSPESLSKSCTGTSEEWGHDYGRHACRALVEGDIAYGLGSRLLVSGQPRWGGNALKFPIAWSCGFTRYHDPSSATGTTAHPGRQ